ncbi:hypothetical protein MJ923_05010 [Shewanella sp. 3B26]|uniref:Bro-N domain-containing protein n=1 Tax=Shewanella zhuhaiensis TaxID=2919576 RepID=A0AAJ1EZ43_9GAMM|nr:BRO family protein [Shewanella zhuhaiensis]MCH4293661.1 hypothetical protein [Shewanella zhuhaiensis]
MYDLNDIHRAFKLPRKNLPHQWRHRDRYRLEASANLRAVNSDGVPKTLATKKGLIAYANWCDYGFYDVVLDAFDALTDGDTVKAQQLAITVLSVHEVRASELYAKGQRGGYAMRQAIEELNGDVAAIIELIDRVVPDFKDGQPYFVAKDVAEALEFRNPKDAVVRLCPNRLILKASHVKVGESPTLGIPNRGLSVIPEGDVYQLVMRSNLPSALTFRDWVCNVVLPSLRKTGAYVVGEEGL